MNPQRRLCAFVLVGLLAAPTAAAPSSTSSAKPKEARSLRSSIGIGAAKPLLRADSSEARRRGFERLGTNGGARALELLARALDSGGAARDARERLSVVRALAPHALQPTAQDALIRALGGVEGQSEQREQLVERTAALALAASRHPLALAALSRALRQPGRVSEAARTALLSHPPPRLGPILTAAGAPTRALVTLLGELGDARARPLLVKLVAKSTPELEALSLGALFRLDQDHAVELARAALKRESDPLLRVAAVRVLALSSDPDASAALSSLLETPSTQSDALDIALEAPSPALGPALAAAQAPEGEADRLLAALGRAGGTAALARLERELSRPDNTWSAAYALARCEDPAADGVLERALERPVLRRDALRAAVVRFAVRGRSVSGLDAAIAALSRGALADREASAWSRAVLEPKRAVTLFSSSDVALVRAVARQAFRPELASTAALRLDKELNADLVASLASALAVPEAAALVPTARLIELYERRGAESTLAAYALALRDSEELRPRIREMLASGDPTLRAHAALGLAASTESSAVALLAEAYRFELEPLVRRAIVSALAARPERAKRRTLELAAALDPDDVARARARAGLRPGPSLSQATPAASGTLWLHVVPPPAGANALVLVETALGLALPLAPDADGSLTVAELPEGELDVSLATTDAKPTAPTRAPH